MTPKTKAKLKSTSYSIVLHLLLLLLLLGGGGGGSIGGAGGGPGSSIGGNNPSNIINLTGMTGDTGATGEEGQGGMGGNPYTAKIRPDSKPEAKSEPAPKKINKPQVTQPAMASRKTTPIKAADQPDPTVLTKISSPENRPVERSQKELAMARPEPVRQEITEKILQPEEHKQVAKLEQDVTKLYNPDRMPMPKKQLTQMDVQDEVKSLAGPKVSKMSRTQGNPQEVKEAPAISVALADPRRETDKSKTKIDPSERAILEKTLDYNQVTKGMKSPTTVTDYRVNYENKSIPMRDKKEVTPREVVTEIKETTTTQISQIKRVTVRETHTVAQADNTAFRKPTIASPTMVEEKQLRQDILPTDTSAKVKLEKTVTYTEKEPVTMTSRPDAMQRITYQQTRRMERAVEMPTALNIKENITYTKEAVPEAVMRQQVAMKKTDTLIVKTMDILPETERNMDKSLQATATVTKVRKEVSLKKEVQYQEVVKDVQIQNDPQRRVVYDQTTKVNREQKNLDEQKFYTTETDVNAKQTDVKLASLDRQKLTRTTDTKDITNAVLERRNQADQTAVTTPLKQDKEAHATTQESERVSYQRTDMMSNYSVSEPRDMKSNSLFQDSRGAGLGQTGSGSLADLPGSGHGIKGAGGGGGGKSAHVAVNMPNGNMVSEGLYILTGSIGGDGDGGTGPGAGGGKGGGIGGGSGGNPTSAFVTVNGVTQLVGIVDGKFSAELSMGKGVNTVSLLVFKDGGVTKKEFKLLFNPPMGVPVIKLMTPENGRQGLKEGDPVTVTGTVNDPSIDMVTLYMNNIPVSIKVVNGYFSRKVFLPSGRITTFRIMARKENGPAGYSPVHTVLTGYQVDILNPRPY